MYILYILYYQRQYGRGHIIKWCIVCVRMEWDGGWNKTAPPYKRCFTEVAGHASRKLLASRLEHDWLLEPSFQVPDRSSTCDERRDGWWSIHSIVPDGKGGRSLVWQQKEACVIKNTEKYWKLLNSSMLMMSSQTIPTSAQAPSWWFTD